MNITETIKTMIAEYDDKHADDGSASYQTIIDDFERLNEIQAKLNEAVVE